MIGGIMKRVTATITSSTSSLLLYERTFYLSHLFIPSNTLCIISYKGW